MKPASLSIPRLVSPDLDRSLIERAVRRLVPLTIYAGAVIVAIGMLVAIGGEIFLSMTGAVDPFR
jgi:hypothetical protein